MLNMTHRSEPVKIEFAQYFGLDMEMHYKKRSKGSDRLALNSVGEKLREFVKCS